MSATTTTIAERVAAGAAWLDEHEPGWVDLIDLDKLNLASGCRCILGQLESPRLDPDYDPPDTAYVEALDHYGVADPDGLGFNVEPALPRQIRHEQFQALTAAWRELIQQRRAEQ